MTTSIKCPACGELATSTGTCRSCGQADQQARPPSLVSPDSETGLAVVTVEVAVDPDYFDVVVTEGEIELPDPLPEPLEVQVAGRELQIGRTSESRAIRPDLDVAELTGDPAVSTRHAVLRRSDGEHFTITDVGSTNGTFLSAVDSPAIEPGKEMELKPGTPIYVGAWTRLVLLED